MVDSPSSQAPCILVQGLVKRYRYQTVLNQLNLTLQDDTLCILVGENGVGKTTLLRALAGLQAHAGSVAINGSRPDLGLVFQNPDLQLFNPSVREEVLYRLSEPDMKLYEWLLSHKLE